MKNKTRWVALMGMLFALAIALSFVESMVTPLLGLAPGIKLGLANVVVMYALLCLDWRAALTLDLLKALFALLTRGAVAGLLSLCGGLLSLAVMLLLLRLQKQPNWFALSVCGAISHNLGQLIGVCWALNSQLALGYAPVLLLAGLAVGSATAGVLRLVMPALQHMEIAKNFKRK